MNRLSVHFGLVVTCLALLWCVQMQHRRLADLRAQEQRLLARISGPSDAGGALANPRPAGPGSHSGTSPELLRLRSELTRLELQKRELAGVHAENQRLKERLEARASIPDAAPSRAYFTAENARFVGYNSPEDTVQSVFWAIQHRDVTNLLQAFTPQMVEQFRQQVPTQALDEFLRGRAMITNLTILDRTAMPDGSVELSIQTPENQSPEKTRFYLINGQWKIGEPAH